MTFGPGPLATSDSGYAQWEKFYPYNGIENHAVGLTHDLRLIASEITGQEVYTDATYHGDTYGTSNQAYHVREFDFSTVDPENKTEAMDLVYVFEDGELHQIRDDYAFVAFATGGAAWNIDDLYATQTDSNSRSAVAFLAAFEKIKAEELVPDTTDPPTTSPGGKFPFLLYVLWELYTNYL